jgi:endonuclease/exonuclease/phosphatase family metal-dependent hydrolase
MGNAIISRWPFHSTWNSPLPSIREKRGLIQGEIRIKGIPITLMCTHWGLQGGERQRQSEACVELANAVKTPLIFAGDLNAPEDAEEIQSLLRDADLTDAWPGCPPTYAIAEPTVRIDYILTRGSFALISRGRIETDASDHFAVVAHFELATE